MVPVAGISCDDSGACLFIIGILFAQLQKFPQFIQFVPLLLHLRVFGDQTLVLGLQLRIFADQVFQAPPLFAALAQPLPGGSDPVLHGDREKTAGIFQRTGQQVRVIGKCQQQYTGSDDDEQLIARRDLRQRRTLLHNALLHVFN